MNQHFKVKGKLVDVSELERIWEGRLQERKKTFRRIFTMRVGIAFVVSLSFLLYLLCFEIVRRNFDFFLCASALVVASLVLGIFFTPDTRLTSGERYDFFLEYAPSFYDHDETFIEFEVTNLEIKEKGARLLLVDSDYRVTRRNINFSKMIIKCSFDSVTVARKYTKRFKDNQFIHTFVADLELSDFASDLELIAWVLTS